MIVKGDRHAVPYFCFPADCASVLHRIECTVSSLARSLTKTGAIHGPVGSFAPLTLSMMSRPNSLRAPLSCSVFGKGFLGIFPISHEVQAPVSPTKLIGVASTSRASFMTCVSTPPVQPSWGKKMLVASGVVAHRGPDRNPKVTMPTSRDLSSEWLRIAPSVGLRQMIVSVPEPSVVTFLEFRLCRHRPLGTPLKKSGL